MTELEELPANPNAPASGNVIESQLDPGRGPVVTVLVQRGTLQVGDSLVAGPQWGRVGRCTTSKARSSRRPCRGCRSRSSASTGSPMPANRPGGRERPQRPPARPGARRPPAREALAAATPARSPRRGVRPGPGRRHQGAHIFLKADVAGSLEALQDELARVPQERVAIDIIHSSRRHQRVRRDARFGLRGDHHRLQRAAVGRCPPRRRRARASTSGPTGSSTASSRTCATRWRVCSSRIDSRTRSASSR